MNLKNKLRKEFIRFNSPESYKERVRKLGLVDEDVEYIVREYKRVYRVVLDRMRHNSYDVKLNGLLNGEE